MFEIRDQRGNALAGAHHIEDGMGVMRELKARSLVRISDGRVMAAWGPAEQVAKFMLRELGRVVGRSHGGARTSRCQVDVESTPTGAIVAPGQLWEMLDGAGRPFRFRVVKVDPPGTNRFGRGRLITGERMGFGRRRIACAVAMLERGMRGAHVVDEFAEARRGAR